MKRRRFIKILASSAIGMGVAPHLGFAQSKEFNPVRWQGYTMGAMGQFSIYDSPTKAKEIIQICFAEIRRLEKIFSLYDSNSEICTLNNTGVLNHPSPEWRSMFEVVDRIHAETNGLFDPTIQPLWNLYSGHSQAFRKHQLIPNQQQIDEVTGLVGWTNVHWSKTRVDFGKIGMQISLNGIAQGFITDRITDMIKNEGFEQVLVELGETRAIGLHPSKRPWSVGIKDANGLNHIYEVASLNDQAIATSFSEGSYIDYDERIGHALHPMTGMSNQHKWCGVSVIAPTAAEADGLSTALLLTDEFNIKRIEERDPRIRIVTQS